MSLLSIYILPFLILLPGLACWLAFGSRLKARLTGLEAVFLWLLIGTACISWLSLTLAEFELFSLPLLSTTVIGLSLTIIGWAALAGRLQSTLFELPWVWQDLLVGALLFLLVILSGRPSEYIIGGRDHGVYVNTGIHIAKTGGILVYDSDMPAIADGLKPTIVWPETRLYQAGFPGPWSEGQRLSGLTIRDLETGIYLPHAFHLYPALIATFFAAGGVPAALATTMFLALLGSLAIYLTVVRLFGRPVGLLALALLVFSVTQVWFTGYPTAEIMVQLFFWGGLFSFVLLLDSEDPLAAVVAGGCWGLLHLAKLDTVLIPLTAGLAFFYLWLQQKIKPGYWRGVGVYLFLTFQAAWHATFFATTYFLDHAVRNLLPAFIADALVSAASGYPDPTVWLQRLAAANWTMLLLGGVIFMAGLVAINRLRPIWGRQAARLFRQPLRWQKLITGGLLISFLGTAVVSTIWSVPALEKTLSAVQLSRLYLTRAGLLAAGAGWLLLFYRSESSAQRLSLFIIVGNVFPLYLLGAGTSPDHFWVSRRFIPIAFPALLMGAAWFIWSIWQLERLNKWLRMAVALGVLAVILAGFGQHLRFVARVVEYDGLTEQLAAVSQRLPENSILLIQTGTPAQTLSLPLWFLFDKSVFSIRGEVKGDPLLEAAVSGWLAWSYPVYWIATAETPPPVWQNWQQPLRLTHTIDVPKMETPRDRIPHQVGRLQLELSIYELMKP